MAKIEKPLYTRGSSKIGSGVIRPFQPNAASHQISNTLVQQQHAQLASGYTNVNQQRRVMMR